MLRGSCTDRFSVPFAFTAGRRRAPFTTADRSPDRAFLYTAGWCTTRHVSRGMFFRLFERRTKKIRRPSVRGIFTNQTRGPRSRSARYATVNSPSDREFRAENGNRDRSFNSAGV